MIREADDRRWKIVQLSPYTILAQFTTSKEKLEYFTNLSFDLPDDYVIDSIYYDVAIQAYCFCIYHPSFGVVPYSSLPPVLDANARTVRFKGEFV